MFIDLRGKELFFRKIPSTFERFYTEREEEQIVKKLYNQHTFNGDSVRVEHVEVKGDKALVVISPSKFYQLLTTTLIVNRNTDELPPKAREYQSKVGDDLGSIEKVLANKLLSNDTTVSVMVKDREGNYLLARRGAKVAVGTSLLSTTVTGSVDGDDIDEENPIKNAVIREVEEELHIQPEDIEVEIIGIFMGDIKLQPVFICNATYNGVFDDEWLDNSMGLSDENKYFNKLTPEELSNYRVARGRLTEAGVFHLDIIKGG